MAATLTPELYVSKQIPNHATLKPELYISKQIPNNSTLTPELFVSKQIPNHSSLKPELFVSGKFQFNVKDDYDTEVEYKNTPAWRYENAGYKEQTLLYGTTIEATSEKSTTGTAWYQTNRKPCFPIPSCDEVWIKTDIWNSGTTQWRVQWGYDDGLLLWNGKLTLDIGGSGKQNTSISSEGLHTLLAHFKSGTQGLVEYWWDGVKIYTYEGATGNNGAETMDTLFFMSNNSNVLFSNTIISNEEIGLDDNVSPNDKQWLMPSFSANWSTSQDFCGKMSNNGKVAWLFDYDMSDKIAIYNGISVSLYMKTAVMVKHLYLYSGDATLLPTDMTLECSDDGETWTTCGSLEPDTSGYKVINATVAKPYNYYRLTGNDTTEKSLSNIHIDAVTGLPPVSFTSNFDTKISLSNLVQMEADTKRLILGEAIHAEVKADTKRTIANEITPKFDTKREVTSILVHVIVSSDTARVKRNRVDAEFDTQRNKVLILTVEADTKRDVKAAIYHVEVPFDTKRNLSFQIEPEFDTIRILPHFVNVEIDTKRLIAKSIEFAGDTSRKLPHCLDKLANSGIQSVNLHLQPGTLSDTFTLTGINKIYPKDVVEGVLLDFPYHFQAEETSENGILFTVGKTMYDADKMLYMPIIYSLKDFNRREFTARDGSTTIKGYAASQHSEKFASALGFEFHFLADDFLPKEDYSGTETTYQSLLSSLYGWTSNVPRRRYIVFVRNKTELYVLERGHETGNIDFDSYRWFNHPSYNRKLIRTTWSKPTTELEGISGGVSKGVYFISKNDQTPKPKDDGVTDTEENVERNDGMNDNRVKYTERKNPDGSTTRTDYDYISTGRNYLVRQITEVTTKPTTTDPTTGVTVAGYTNTRVTKYSYLPGGWRHMVVYENNVKVEESEDHSGEVEDEVTNNTASSVYRGRAGDEGNEFVDNQTDLAYGGSWKTSGVNGSTLLNTVDVPVKDYNTASMYLSELEWMDRCIEETATLTITAPVKNGVVADEDNHVFDFFDTYTLNGKEYYMESNTVTLTPRSLTQQLTLIRWYK